MKRKEEKRKEEEERRRMPPAAAMMEVVVGKLPHATTSPELEETAPSFVIFFLEPWSKPDIDHPPQDVPVQTAVDGASLGPW